MDQKAPKNEPLGLASDPPDCSADEAARIARELFGLDGTPEPKRGERDRNFRIRAADGRDVVLKFLNAAEDIAVVDMQTEALRHIARQDPGLPVPRVVPTLEGLSVATASLEDGRDLLVRCLTYLPGEILWDCDRHPGLARNAGAFVARTDRALRGFFHPAANQYLAWDLMRVPDLLPFADLIGDAEERDLVSSVLKRFCDVTIPMMRGLRAQIIHNDANLGNLLADPARPGEIAGLIDFGDMVHGSLAAELAVCAADFVLEADDPLGAAASLTAGYHELSPLEGGEVEVLFDAIMARLAVTLAIHAWRWDRADGETPADISYETPCREALKALTGAGREEAERRLRDACGLSPARPSAGHAPLTELVARRRRLLGADLSLSYDEPLHLVRGEGVYMYDPQGRAYVDAYNNVAHVGHCHPHVVAAITRQAALLNTNTRYLHETILDYSERLTAKLPDGLDVCVFVNSGSEANDIAWRMAKSWTGREGALITEDAYHGGTDAIIALSPEEYETPALRPYVRRLEAPNTYRGRFGADHEDAGEAYAQDADRAIAELEDGGHGLAALMVDSGFTSDGILDVPQGYLGAVVQKVHAAGGVLIADEVQYGLGRPGSHFWGFGLLGVEPDIVTLGKPVGNGHPIGVVVTRREILDAFNADAGYFSTFGGNPVSCAAALATLEVIERESLQDNARDTGAYLKEKLVALGRRHELIGDVRGTGFVIGVELVHDRQTRQPAARERDVVINHMKSSGVLVGRTGRLGNVVKIRPPMPFARQHADLLVDAMDRALGAATEV